MVLIAIAFFLLFIAALVWAVAEHFGTVSAIESATLDYRVAIEFAVDRPCFLEAGEFITLWSSDPQRASLAWPAFQTYRAARIVEEKSEETAA